MSLIEERWKGLIGSWAGVAALGTFALQAAGFLSLRFHLAALGISADLGLLDARYLFEGANCLIFILTALSSWMLLLLMIFVPAWLVSRLIPSRHRTRIISRVSAGWNQRISPLLSPSRLSWIGVAASVLLIQFVLRQCLQFRNLLLASEPLEPRWLATILLSESDVLLSLFLGGTVLGIGVTVSLWLASLRDRNKTFGSHALGFLIVLEIGLIPINYGVLTANRPVERVSGIGSLPARANSWLVWEDERRMVILVDSSLNASSGRSLSILPNGASSSLQVHGRSRILSEVFLRGKP